MQAELRPVGLAAALVFNIDKGTLSEVRRESRAQLDALAPQLNSGVKVATVRLVGHADRLNNTSNSKRNLHLSEKAHRRRARVLGRSELTAL